jgi:hypothetical protein
MRPAPDVAQVAQLAIRLPAPFFVAEGHLRVVTVRDRAWVHELDAAGVDLDWRITSATDTVGDRTAHAMAMLA